MGDPGRYRLKGEPIRCEGTRSFQGAGAVSRRAGSLDGRPLSFVCPLRRQCEVRPSLGLTLTPPRLLGVLSPYCEPESSHSPSGDPALTSDCRCCLPLLDCLCVCVVGPGLCFCVSTPSIGAGVRSRAGSPEHRVSTRGAKTVCPLGRIRLHMRPLECWSGSHSSASRRGRRGRPASCLRWC